jgi:hypothetical protein
MASEKPRDGHEAAIASADGGALLPLGTDGTRPLPSLAKSEPAQFRIVLVSFLAAGIGLVAGGVAFLLYKLIGLFTNLFFFHRWDATFVSARLNHLGLWVIVTPVVGGIIVGIMAKYGTPKIKGHGIPEAMEAVLVNRSRIEPRVAILKPISAAIAIGTGGPFGAEGPIIQTGGAVGSLVGQVFHTTASERKVLLACGAAAGMSATFNTPIAGVILAIELLLFEFKIALLHSPRHREHIGDRGSHATAGRWAHVLRRAHGLRHSPCSSVLPGAGRSVRTRRRRLQQAAVLGRRSIREVTH